MAWRRGDAERRTHPVGAGVHVHNGKQHDALVVGPASTTRMGHALKGQQMLLDQWLAREAEGACALLHCPVEVRCMRAGA